MLNEQTCNEIAALRLYGMLQGFKDRLARPDHAELSHGEFTGLIVQDEKVHRENQRLKRLLKDAKLRVQVALEDVNHKHPRGLNKQVLLDLGSPQWIIQHKNVLLTGPTGIGKTFLACALGNMAARAGLTVLYLRAPRLFEFLLQARGQGTHLKALAKIAKVQLLILDDFLLTPPADAERKELLEIIEDRYGAGSTIITSQCPLDQWHEHIGDPTLADAILDRLFHNAFKIPLKGASFRSGRDSK